MPRTNTLVTSNTLSNLGLLLVVILYCTAYHPILFGSIILLKILLLVLSTSVQDFAILLQSGGIFTGSLSPFVLNLKLMLITCKVLHDQTPIYIQELLQLHTPSRNLRSSNRNLLVKPYFILNSYGKQAFSVAALELWNNLPEDIKSANSIDDFKRKLTTFLLCELTNRDVLNC